MKTNRRTFISSAALAGGAAALSPVSLAETQDRSRGTTPDYAALDRALSMQVQKRENYSAPVFIEKQE